MLTEQELSPTIREDKIEIRKETLEVDGEIQSINYWVYRNDIAFSLNSTEEEARKNALLLRNTKLIVENIEF